MGKVVTCPTCGAKCKTEKDKESGEVNYKALQDEDAFKKIQQLKEALKKERQKE